MLRGDLVFYIFFFSLDCNFHFYFCLDFQRNRIHIEWNLPIFFITGFLLSYSFLSYRYFALFVWLKIETDFSLENKVSTEQPLEIS